METLNPFDDENQPCYILRNAEYQYSLWPDFSAIPAGWASVFGPAPRGQCITWLEQHWQDIRPTSQRRA
ncbi:antibiotic synthesis protein MbtH [Chania multitudinisentens RB-25]|uniref:Antibiotic synthesis protein MbtH n=1 Tax=Chania multitudinisentens RB-25 TaxID=1441930 RepID=W0L544_9GAMM|nr:MbtH family protein [Chania multitudinisentens]AHG18893.1 antibiotic synthesis protein MbtH [Chania multitudinisentens RB-25]